MCEVPLTYDQRLFAAEYQGLVYKFLNANHLPEDEFYDVVIFGYLKAVQNYFSNPELQKYSFTTIAWRRMQGYLQNHLRTQNRRKRRAEVVSIHVRMSDTSLPLEQTLSKPDEWMLQLETKLLLHDLAGRVSRQQMDMIRMKSDGYGIREIARSQKVPMKRVKEVLEDVYQILMDLCCE